METNKNEISETESVVVNIVAGLESKVDSQEAIIIELRDEITQAKTENAELTTKLAAAVSSKESWYTSHSESKAELEQMHSVFDGISVPRQTKQEQEYGGCSVTVYNLPARMAYFLNTLIK